MRGKLLWGLVGLLILCAGCGGGGSGGGVTDRVVGTWAMTGLSYSLGGPRIPPSQLGYEATWQFYGNGTYYSVVTAPQGTATGRGSWERVGDQYPAHDSDDGSTHAFTYQAGELYLVTSNGGTVGWLWFSKL